MQIKPNGGDSIEFYLQEETGIFTKIVLHQQKLRIHLEARNLTLLKYDLICCT